MIDWLNQNKSDYKEIAIDNQSFPSDAVSRITQIANSPHTQRERRDLILKFCDHFNMPYYDGVPEAIRMIGEWQNLKK